MYCRHDLVWLTPGGWAAALEQAAPPYRAALERWQREDWPAIVRRRDADVPPSTLSAGVALPPENGVKPRIALRLDAVHVARQSRPLRVAGLVEAAPGHWRAALESLAAGVEGHDVGAYGSLALQSITGLGYMTPKSDIDLLLRPSTRDELDNGVALLTAASAQLPLDGEIMFPNGDAVAWKEWRDAAAGAKVLVKSITAVRLADRSQLLGTLGAV